MAKDMFEMPVISTEMAAKLQVLADKSPDAFNLAMKQAGLQFLTWCNDGSTNESRKPPIKEGTLRGSSSVFVGGELVGVYEGEDNSEANRSMSSEGATDLTIGWNTAYAARMHETDYSPGVKSAKDGDAGNKWLERHIQADKEDLLELIATFFRKEMGT